MAQANLFQVHFASVTGAFAIRTDREAMVCIRDFDPPRLLTRDQALNLACWIVAICDPGLERLPGMVEEVLGS